MMEIFAAIVGGLGSSQLLAPEPSVAGVMVLANVPTYGAWKTDAYKSNPAENFDLYPSRFRVGVGHSLGCRTLVESGIRFDYLCLIEPVSWGEPIRFPTGALAPTAYDVFIADALFNFPIRIEGCEVQTIKNTSHNSITHCAEVLAKIAARITALTQSFPSPAAPSVPTGGAAIPPEEKQVPWSED